MFGEFIEVTIEDVGQDLDRQEEKSSSDVKGQKNSRQKLEMDKGELFLVEYPQANRWERNRGPIGSSDIVKVFWKLGLYLRITGFRV